MSDHWYVARGEKQKGPYSSHDLKRFAEKKQLLPTDQLWKEGMTGWVPASRVNGIFAEAVRAEPEEGDQQIELPTPAAIFRRFRSSDEGNQQTDSSTPPTTNLSPIEPTQPVNLTVETVPAKTAQRSYFHRLLNMGKCESCLATLSIMETGYKAGKCAACLLRQGELIARPDEQIAFTQAASHKGGLPDHPEAAKKPGFVCVAHDHFYYFDPSLGFKLPWEQVRTVELDHFKMSGLRAVLAGANAIMMQNVKNVLAVIYLDQNGHEWTAKFQIHGALSIPGEQEKAIEVLNHIIQFKPRFHDSIGHPVGKEDVVTKIENLARLKNAGIISNADFERKKQELLDRI